MELEPSKLARKATWQLLLGPAAGFWLLAAIFISWLAI